MIRALKAEGLRKKLNEKFELMCSLQLIAGKVYVLLGPNGSGKSTLLKIIGLLDPPDEGRVVYISDKEYTNPYNQLSIRRKVALVHTSPVVFRESVLGNVTYGLRLRGYSKAEAEQRALSALEKVNLLDLKDSMATVLSSGERQRLSLARALAIEPDVLLLDEPTVNLDPENTQIIEEAISDISCNSEKIILFVTHNIFQAKRLAHEVVLMYRGRIIEQKEKDEFFRSPSTDIAKKFISGQIY